MFLCLVHMQLSGGVCLAGILDMSRCLYNFQKIAVHLKDVLGFGKEVLIPRLTYTGVCWIERSDDFNTPTFGMQHYDS